MGSGFRNAWGDAMRWKLKNTRGDAMRWKLPEQNTHGAMRCDLICNFPAWPAWPESCSFLWLRLKTYASQSPWGDAMRFFVHGAIRCDFGRQITWGDAMRLIFSFKRHDAMRCDRFWKLEDTGRCNAMDVRNLKARDDAMR